MPWFMCYKGNTTKRNPKKFDDDDDVYQRAEKSDCSSKACPPRAISKSFKKERMSSSSLTLLCCWSKKPKSEDTTSISPILKIERCPSTQQTYGNSQENGTKFIELSPSEQSQTISDTPILPQGKLIDNAEHDTIADQAIQINYSEKNNFCIVPLENLTTAQNNGSTELALLNDKPSSDESFRHSEGSDKLLYTIIQVENDIPDEVEDHDQVLRSDFCDGEPEIVVDSHTNKICSSNTFNDVWSPIEEKNYQEIQDGIYDFKCNDEETTESKINHPVTFLCHNHAEVQTIIQNTVVVVDEDADQKVEQISTQDETTIPIASKKKRTRSRNRNSSRRKRQKKGENYSESTPLESPMVTTNNQFVANLGMKDIWIKDIRTGNKKGITWMANSCYLDATLFSIIYTSSIFEQFLRQGISQVSYATDNDSYAMPALNVILSDIIEPLRRQCPVSGNDVMKLRKILNKKCESTRFTSNMMDVDELINALFEQVLQLKWFINYTGGTFNHMHQIFFDPSTSTGGIIDVQSLLEESMTFQELTFQGVPYPLLIIKMSRDCGDLVGYDGILPNLELSLNSLMDPRNEKVKIYLLAVIVLSGMHYTAYARNGIDINSDWFFFNSLGPVVNNVPLLGERLHGRVDDLLNRTSNINKPTRNYSDIVSQIAKNNHVCIYVSCDDNV